MSENRSERSVPIEPDAVASDARPVGSPPVGKAQWTRSLVTNVVLPLLLLGVGGFACWVMISMKPDPEERPPADQSRDGLLQALPVVRVEKIQSLDSTGARLHLTVDGTVVPFREAVISAEVAGQIIYQAPECEAGSFVRKGDVLMKIDPTNYDLEVQRLTRMQTQEYQAIKEVDQEKANTQLLIDVAKDDVKLQENELNRQRSFPKGFSSPAEIDRAARAVLQSKQQLVTAENQLRLLETRRVRLEASEQLVAVQLEAAKKDLERTTIKAPIDGVIVRESAEINHFVSRGTPLIAIEDISKVEVAASLRMDQLHWILDQERTDSDEGSRGYDLPKTPALIEYSVSGRDGIVYRWKGTLNSYDGIGLDPDTRTVPVRVVVDDPQKYSDANGNLQKTKGPSALVRGMYVKIKLLIKPRTPLVVVPAKALRPGNRVWQFVVDESVLKPESDTKEVAANQSPPSEASTEVKENAFDATKWSPGRVAVRRSVTPVDMLSIDTKGRADSDSHENAGGPVERQWVCEVRDQLIEDGSFVVVSQLGSLEDGVIPARADASVVGNTNAVAGSAQTSTDKLTSSQSASSDAGSVE